MISKTRQKFCCFSINYRGPCKKSPYLFGLDSSIRLSSRSQIQLVYALAESSVDGSSKRDGVTVY